MRKIYGKYGTQLRPSSPFLLFLDRSAPMEKLRAQLDLMLYHSGLLGAGDRTRSSYFKPKKMYYRVLGSK